MMKTMIERRYFVDSAAKVLDVLDSFGDSVEELSITEVARRAGLTYSSAFRLLYTLEKRGYVMRRQGRKRYSLTPARKRYRVGYAALGSKGFGEEVSRGLAVAARRFGVSLLTKNNEFSLSKALTNADELLAENIDLLIEYQLHETASHLIAAKCHDAGIPVLAINFAQPGAYYFGGDNYKTGLLAADYVHQLACATENHRSAFFVVFPAKGMGSTQEVRKTGFIDYLTRANPRVSASQIIVGPPVLTTQDGYAHTKELIRRTNFNSGRIFIAALTDPPAIGAERAVKEAGIQDKTVIVGQGAGRDVRVRLRRGGPFKASVAYFPEGYGERVLAIALRILAGEKVPLTSYTNHVLVTSANLVDHYPESSE